MALFSSIAAFLFAAIALIIPSGFSLGALMLTLGALLLMKKRPLTVLGKQDYILIGVFAFYFIGHVGLNILHHASGREYDAPLRFLLAIAAMLFLVNTPPKPAFVWSGFAVGGLTSGAYALWQFFIVGLGRAEGTTNPIQYGNISLILGIMCLAGIGWAWQQKHRRQWVFLMSAGFLAGTIGSLFTGSRGSWIALPVCLVILVILLRNKIPKTALTGGILAFIIAVTGLYYTPQTHLKERITIAKTEMQAYFNTGDASTSVGTRLEMWRSASLMIPQHPIAGWGSEGYKHETKRLADAGIIGITPSLHTHVHNDYLDATVKNGLLGLLAVMLLYFVPIILFSRQLAAGNKKNAPYAIAGILLYCSYIMFGLTQSFLTHNNGVMILAFSTMILWAGARQHNAHTHS